ncbi:MAG: glutathione peroxidase [Bacteroidia bacterium]|jgi:glutathione peroxidase|nr:glutathione peroxidase [Bacteroidia bacterium]
MLFLVPLFKNFLKGKTPNSIHQQTIKTLSGKPISLGDFKGKKLLIVNTASKCGFTPQYKALQTLHDRFSEKGLVILAFPCNDFGNQEPGNEKNISEFCEVNFGLSFPLMEKLHVKGPDQHSLYKWLCTKKRNGVLSSRVVWNFQKYLIDERGFLVDVLAPWKSPLDKAIVKWLSS